MKKENQPKPTTENPQKTLADSVESYHSGNGWYSLPNGKSVRGKENALKQLGE